MAFGLIADDVMLAEVDDMEEMLAEGIALGGIVVMLAEIGNEAGTETGSEIEIESGTEMGGEVVGA